VNSYCWANSRIEDAGLRLNFWPEILAGSWQQSRIKTFCLAAAMYLAHKNRLFDAITHWIAISDFVRQKFIQAGIPENKITTLKHYYSITQTIPTTPQEEPYYLFLGRLCEEKGLPTLLQTWEILHHKLGSSTPKLIIGGTGPLQSSITSSANPYIDYRGYIEKETKKQLLTYCRALLVPSTCWEALGRVVHEAYDYCKPVLAAASGGLSETVQHGLTGYLHPPGDPSALAKQILALESLTPEKRLSMGIAGHRWLETYASLELWQQKINTLLHRALEQFHRSRV
jgi:glycosyltransferase involved in cell wall biosynthesis